MDVVTYQLIDGSELGWVLVAEIRGEVDVGASDIVVNNALIAPLGLLKKT